MSKNDKTNEHPTFAERRILTGEGHFHFVTVTAEGLEILGEPSGEKTVINELAAMRHLNVALLDWLQKNTCPAFLLDPGSRNDSRLPCELRSHHSDELHFARRYDPTWSRVIGAVYWSDDKHAAEFHNSK